MSGAAGGFVLGVQGASPLAHLFSFLNNWTGILDMAFGFFTVPIQDSGRAQEELNAFQTDPLLIARTGFHHPALTKTPYDRGSVALLAVNGDHLARRVVAQELLRDGKPGPAIPLLFWCMASRQPPARRSRSCCWRKPISI